jgi:predicted nucleic acid-binding protein
MTPVLVDTSAWVGHLNRGDTVVASLLEAGHAVTHPWVTGELACGQIKNRAEVLAMLARLPAATVADHREVMLLIEDRRLMGRGLSYTDVHLLASALLDGVLLWTYDKNLLKVAKAAGMAFT